MDGWLTGWWFAWLSGRGRDQSKCQVARKEVEWSGVDQGVETSITSPVMFVSLFVLANASASHAWLHFKSPDKLGRNGSGLSEEMSCQGKTEAAQQPEKPINLTAAINERQSEQSLHTESALMWNPREFP
ncbi:hypothetical protein ACLKA6_013395 [Drosophila palustris]